MKIQLGSSWKCVFLAGLLACLPPSPGELAEGLAGPGAAKQEVGSGRQGGGLGGTPRYPLYLFMHLVDAFCAPPPPPARAPEGIGAPWHPGAVSLLLHMEHLGVKKKTPLLGFFQVVSSCINVFFFWLFSLLPFSPRLFPSTALPHALSWWKSATNFPK